MSPLGRLRSFRRVRVHLRRARGIEGRYLAPLVPALVILAYFGIEWLLRSRAVGTRAVVLGVSFLAILAADYRFPYTISCAGMNDIGSITEVARPTVPESRTYTRAVNAQSWVALGIL
jgi:hypothetical protein